MEENAKFTKKVHCNADNLAVKARYGTMWRLLARQALLFHCLAIKYPIATAAMPMAKLPSAYKANAPHLPDCTRASDSLENVEKVVNPPHSPTVKASRTVSDHPKRSHHPPNSPMAKLPPTLTASVAHGNAAAPMQSPTA